MSVNLSLLAGAGWQFFNNSGVPLSGGLLYTYAAGTTTPLAAYTTSVGNIAHSNPIVLDSAGRVPSEIWLTAGSDYKFILQTAVGVQIGSYDNIPGANDISSLANTSNPALGDALVGFRQSNSSGLLPNSVGKTVHDKLQESVSVFDFMTQTQIAAVRADNYTVVTAAEITTAIQNAVNAKITGGTIFFPSGTYRLSTSIIKPMSFVGPSLIGEGFQTTKFYYPALAASNKAAIEYIGGSGGLSDIIICGFTFEGAINTPAVNGTTAILIDGQGGVLIYRCAFSTNYFGVNFNNRTGGAFTEYCVIDYCQFAAVCSVKIYYSKASGTSSFNGSGFRNCTFNVDSSITNNPIVVVEDNCLVYNAPASGQLWSAGSTSTVFIRNNNTGTLRCNWYGSLTIEVFVSSATIVLGLSPSGASISYTGQIVSLNQYYSYGSLTNYFDYYVTASSSFRGSRKPYRIYKAATTGTTTIPLLCEPSNAIVVTVVIDGINYTYSHVLTIMPGIGIGAAGYLLQQLDGQAFNSAAWGICTFGIGGTLSAPALTVTNATAGFNTTVTLGITQIGWEQP
jgi:hypothetical protein